MTDITVYRKEKEKREQIRNNYKEKIMRHKLKTLYRILLGVVALAVVIVLIVIQYQLHVYTGYDIVSTVSLETSSNAENVRLQNHVLTYSKDGAHCTNSKGEITWNQTYEMQNVELAVCRNTVAIADYNGREIYVCDGDKQLGTITTNMPVRDVTVSLNGNVTAVLADTDVTWINTYDAAGNMLFQGQTRMDETGYPVSVSLSPNGNLLAVSYVYLDAGQLKTNIVFYNFGPVGENMSDHVVGIYFYSDMLVPEVHFVSDDAAFAVGDNRLLVFNGSQTPVNKAGFDLDKEILSVFYGEDKVGLVFPSDDMENSYRMDIYNAAGEKKGTYYFDLEYNDILFEEDRFVIYNETECQIFTYSGTEKFHGTFSKTANILLPTSGAYKYVMVTGTSMDTIQLK